MKLRITDVLGARDRRAPRAGTADRRLVTGGLALAAALALSVAGSTFSAFSDFADVPGNVVGAGVLVIGLDPAGSADVTASFDDLVPGTTEARLLWVSSDASSTPDGTLSLTVHHLVDVPGPCDAGGSKAAAEIAAGIGGCAVVGDTVFGTPARGNLSRVVQFDIAYEPAATDPATCDAATSTTRSAMPFTGRGNLHAAAAANAGTGSTVQLTDGSAPLLLAPGKGVCVAVSASWPETSDPPDAEHPSDNAAQGDSLSVDVRFDLTQVQS